MSNLHRLFIYGTLAPGRANHHVMENISGSWEKATLRGVLIQKGWGAKLGYPGIIPKLDGEVVRGYIFTSEHIHDHWTRLDKFEGEGYERIKVIVKTMENKEVEAYVYALRQSHF